MANEPKKTETKKETKDNSETVIENLGAGKVVVDEGEPVYVRDWRKKVYNTVTNETFDLDEETAEKFATNPNFYDRVFDPNQGKTVLVSILRWEGVDGQKVGS